MDTAERERERERRGLSVILNHLGDLGLPKYLVTRSIVLTAVTAKLLATVLVPQFASVCVKR